jgi:uncharacterized protein
METVAALMSAVAEGEPSDTLHLQLHLHRGLAGKIEVTGSLSGLWSIACGRCLRSLSIPISSTIQATYLPQTQRPNHEELELQEDDLNTDFYQGDTLSLTDLLREVLLLDIPTYPLCGEDCVGLCANCGRNLNEEVCDCAPPPAHLGMAALQERLKS